MAGKFKNKGEDPGCLNRHKHEALGFYSLATCGRCYSATYEAINAEDAKLKGWQKKIVWGWLCPDCKNNTY